MKARPALLVATAFALALAGVWGPAGAASAGAAKPAVVKAAILPITHVVWILEENHSYNQIIGVKKDAYLNSLATTYGSASNAWGITHPSVPNYLGLVSGLPLTSLPNTDCTRCTQAGPDLFTQKTITRPTPLTWRTYLESMTTACQKNASPDGLYVPKHNPPTYFLDITPAACAANDLPFSALATDLKSHNLPQFMYIAPNQNDNMHTTGNLAGQAWLQAQLPALLTSSEFTSGSMVVFILWDEGGPTGEVKGADCTLGTSNSCHIPLLVLSAHTHAVNYATTVTLYSVLKATEDILGLPELGLAQKAPSLRAAFGL